MKLKWKNFIIKPLAFFVISLLLVFCSSCLFSRKKYPRNNDKTVLEIFSELGYTVELDFSDFVSSRFKRKANNLMLYSDDRYFSAGIVSASMEKYFSDYENGFIPREEFQPVFILLEGNPVKINIKRNHYYSKTTRKICYDELIFLQMRIDNEIVDVFDRIRGFTARNEVTKEDFELLENDSVYKEQVYQWLRRGSWPVDEFDFSLINREGEQILKNALENGEKVCFLAAIYDPSYIRKDFNSILRLNGTKDIETSIFGLSPLYPLMPVYDIKVFSDKQSLLDFYKKNAEEFLKLNLDLQNGKLYYYYFN
jgi:hypothetical protein